MRRRSEPSFYSHPLFGRHRLENKAGDGGGNTDSGGAGNAAQNQGDKGGGSGGGGDAAAALAAAQKTAADLQKQIDDMKAAQKTASDKAAKDAADAGDFKKAKELLDAKVAELEGKLAGLEPVAAAGKSYLEREQKRVDEGKQKLSKDWQEHIDALPTIEAKSRALDLALKQTPPGNAGDGGKGDAGDGKPGDPGKQGTPNPNGAIDFAEAWADESGQKWAAAKKRDPKGAAAWFNGAAANPGPVALAHLPTINVLPNGKQ